MFLVSGMDSGGCVFNRIVMVVLYCFSLFMKVEEFFFFSYNNAKNKVLVCSVHTESHFI